MEKLFLLALAIGFAGFISNVHPSGESKLKSLVSIINHTSFALHSMGGTICSVSLSRSCLFDTSNNKVFSKSFVDHRIITCWGTIPGLHSPDKADMLMYKTMAKCRLNFAL